MSFSSEIFLFVFLPIAIIFYYALNSTKLKYIFLISVNLCFILFNGIYSLIYLVVSAFVNYIFGNLIKEKRSKFYLIISIALNIIFLLYFKYFNFFIYNLNFIYYNLTFINVAVPIGISFYTFQSIAFLIDSYQNTNNQSIKFWDFFLYFSFFPKFLSGPIQPIKEFVSQINNVNDVFTNLDYGFKRFIIGLAKKVIIADILGVVVDNIYNLDGTDLSLSIAWLGVLVYSLQIYFDFSGYTDMAIGISKMFGFDLIENFNLPYTSYSLSDFWKRWHISLSTWFKKYIYIPLGGSRNGNVYINLLIVFIITGIWHGANWVFITWGLCHGIYIIIERLLKLNNSRSWISRITTLVFISLVWVLFRSPNLSYAVHYYKVLFNFVQNDSKYYISYFLSNRILFTIFIGVLFSFFRTPLIYIKKVSKAFPILSNLLYIILFLLCFLYLTNSNYNPFIYFQF